MHASVAARPGSTVIGGWRLASSANVREGGAAISTPGYDDGSWFAVSPRSTVLAGLVENDVYPDLFAGTNLRDAVDPADFQVPWWYRADVDVAPGEGLTTFLDVAGVISRGNLWVNGQLLADSGRLAGVWTGHTFNISGLLRPGANSVAIEVFPNDPDRDLTLGWVDWNPAPPDNNMGIVRDLVVRRSGALTLDSVHVLTELAGDHSSAAVTVVADVHNNRETAVSAELAGRIGGLDVSQELDLEGGEARRVSFSLTFERPRLWWPWELGEQPLYDLDLAATVEGAESDRARTWFGVRDVRSSLTADGHRRYEINGVPLLIRGAGWASDMFLRFDRRRLEDQLAYTKDLGLNTIRLEGMLEDEELFQLTDRSGLLVLAGIQCCHKWEMWDGWTPEDEAVAALSAANEARLLRNHPSVIGFLIGSDETPPEGVARTFVDALRENDWPNPIISSAADRTSPVIGPSGLKMSGPWEWVPPIYWYTKRRGGAFGFNSETSAGVSIPPLDTLERALTPAEREALWREPGTDQFHRGPGGRNLFSRLQAFTEALGSRYGAPAGLEDYVLKAQLTAYEVVRAEFEAFARNFNDASQPSTGVVYWMLNNSWPSLHWHLFDHALDQGGAYWGARAANRPLHVQWSYDDGSVVVVNRRPAAVRDLMVTAAVYDVEGVRRYEAEARAISVAGGGGTATAFTIPAVAGVYGAYFIELGLADAGGGVIDRNVYWYSTQGDVVDYVEDPSQFPDSYWFYDPQSQFAALGSLLGLAPVPLDVAAESSRDGELVTTTVTLRNPASAGPPAFFVSVKVRDDGGGRVLPITWSDNAVTLFPGQAATLEASYRASDLGDGAPTVDVFAVNVPRHVVPAGPAAAEVP